VHKVNTPELQPWPQDTVNVRHTVLIALIILGGALLRLFMLTNQSLWFDEGQSLLMTDSRTIAGTLLEMATHTGGDKYQPLYFMMLAEWRSILGDSEFSLRIFSVLPGIVALFFMYATVANIYGSRHAVWSTTYLTFSAFWIGYSQEVRPYSLLFALGAIQLFLLSPMLSGKYKPSTARVLVFSVITGICCFASILLAVLTTALAISHLIVSSKKREWLHCWVPAALACTPAALYLFGTPAVGDLTIDSTNGLGLPLYKNSLFAIYSVLVGHTYGPPLDALRGSGLSGLLVYKMELWLLFVAALALIAGFMQTQISNRFISNHRAPASFTRANAFFVCVLAISFVLAILVAKVSAINWMPRHSFYLSIPLAILLPLTFSMVSSRTGISKLINCTAKAGFIAVLGMNVFASYNYFYKSEYWRDDYRSAASYLATQPHEMDSSIMLWGHPRLLSYYGDTSTQDRWEVNPRPVSTVMDDVRGNGGNIFVAINREFTWARSLPQQIDLQSQVSDNYDLVSVKRYVNFNIYEFSHISNNVTETSQATTQVVESVAM